MKAGTLKDRIKLQRLEAAAGDSSWAKQTAWATEHTVWASVQAVAGGESRNGEGVVSSVVYTIRVRFVPDVTSAWRILWSNRTLDIVSVIDPTGRGRELEIKAVEHVDA